MSHLLLLYKGVILQDIHQTNCSLPQTLHLFYDDVIDVATSRFWLGQGEGFLVEFLDCPGQTTLVKWKDLQDAKALDI
jgi:hypothetical protein